jgi:hypothetical protein
VDAAVALVAASPLLDERWYGEQCGVVFAHREDAARHWVLERDPDASPHPLFEPLWLYPGGRWRGHAPDPLSYHLTHPQAHARGRSPHPCYPQAELGDLAQWLADHRPDELLAPPLARDTAGAEVVVELRTTDVHRAVGWLRHLGRHEPDAVVLVRSAGPAARRLLLAVAAGRPRVLVDAAPELTKATAPAAPAAPVRVVVEESIGAPRWRWLPPLVAALADDDVAAAQPLLLTPEFTVAAPLLVGHPVQDAERLAARPLPTTYPGVVARRTDRSGAGAVRLVPGSRLVGPEHTDPGPAWAPLWEAAGFAGPGRPLTVREGRPSLRWSLDIPAGAGPIGTRWGDWHFARSLASALERLGQWVAIDHPETRGRASRGLDDVVLTLRGLERVDPPAHTTNLLWVIYGPDDVTAEEVAAHDVVFAAGTTWAARRSAQWGVDVRPLLQCTDTTRFHPGVVADPDAPGADGVLFVGNARDGMRPAVRAAVDAGVEATVVGAHWDGSLPAGRVRLLADRIANEDLPGAYAGAAVVLNDHHADMREQGFVSNRVFDVLAVGGRLLSDDVAGLAEVLSGVLPGVELPVWRTPADVARLAAPPYDAFPDAAARRGIAERVVAEHSFDARAATLLEAALGTRAAAGARVGEPAR